MSHLASLPLLHVEDEGIQCMGVMQERSHLLRSAGHACWHMPAALPPWHLECDWCICCWWLQDSCFWNAALQEALARPACKC